MCEQAAAVCFRVCGGEIEFLLVQTRGGGRWTFPKGKAEPGLTHAQVAAMEALEEAGVHGRIEDSSFASYIRSGCEPKRKSGASRREFVVSAHLCEVLRLGAPKETNRKRTWFSAEDAVRRLGERRSSGDGAEFARVIAQAVSRIRWLQRTDDIVECEPGREPVEVRLQNGGQRWAPQHRDALQKVQFEMPANALARGLDAWSKSVSHEPVDQMRQLPKRASLHAKVLPCEIVELDETVQSTFRRVSRNAKALGSGMKNN
jgi:8-oxo-dGTP pyrophosphatase MutT (NUDIX family)